MYVRLSTSCYSMTGKIGSFVIALCKTRCGITVEVQFLAMFEQHNNVMFSYNYTIKKRFEKCH